MVTSELNEIQTEGEYTALGIRNYLWVFIFSTNQTWIKN